MFGFSKDAAVYIHDYLDDHKDEIGIRYVGFGDEQLLGDYPALVVSADPLSREVHGTHMFKIMLRCSIWVYHAKLSSGHRQRTIEDMELSEAVQRLVHADFTLGGNINFGFVDGEDPGIVARTVQGKAQSVIGTRLTWTGESRQTFMEAK